MSCSSGMLPTHKLREGLQGLCPCRNVRPRNKVLFAIALHLFPMPSLRSIVFHWCYNVWDHTLFKKPRTAEVLYTLNVNHCLSMNAYLNSKAKCFGSLLYKSTPGEQLADKTCCEKKGIIITSSSGREYTSLNIAILP